MLTLHLTLDNKQITIHANGQESHSFPLLDLGQTDKEWKEFFKDPRPYGGKLFQTLFKDGSEARKAFGELSKQTERTIVLVLESSELDGIAWEYAFHDGAYLVEDFAFIRALPEKERPHTNGRLSKSVERVPLLFIPANPLVDLSGEPIRELDIESEWREVKQFIEKSNAPFDMIELRPATPASLQSVMARFQNGMIAHFSGHGAATKDGAFLLFENENGSSNPFEAREFVREVKDQAWIGFLSACQSAVAERTAFGNLARELVKTGVPFALGMQFNLPDLFAPTISGQFYNYLSQGHAVPEAARQARRAVKRENEFYVGMIALYAAHPDEAGKMGWTGAGARTLSTFAAADVSDLPAPSGFIGRQSELMNIGTQLLAKKKPNTVTLHGAGGIGKTALMRQALLHFAPSFEAALAIALDPLPSLESVLGRLERFLNLPSPCSNDTKEREKIVRERLTIKHTLLGLDNFETLNYALNNKDSDEEKTAKSLHSFFKYLAANGVTLCVTSREVTNLGGELVIDIEGLPNDVGGRLFQDNIVRQQDKIYIEKTQQVSEMVGGHPLALRLLASAFDDQVGTSLDQYIEDLQSHLPKARDKWTEEDRHESLRASFDFAMNNLLKISEGEELQIALSRLSIFIAFFIAETAALVLENRFAETEEDGNELVVRAKNALHALWEHGMLERIQLPLKNEIFYFYRLHPALNQFAAEKLSIDEKSANQETYWRSMSHLAHRAYPSKDEDNGIYGNLLLTNIVRFAIPDLIKTTKFKYQNRETANILFEVAFLHSHFGELDKSLNLYQQAVTISDELGDLKGKSSALQNMAGIYMTRGELDKAMNISQQSLVIFDELGYVKGKTATLNTIAEIHVIRGNLEDALQLYHQSAEINEEMGNLQGKGIVLGNMAKIYFIHGDLDEAMELYRQAYKVFEESKDLKAMASILRWIAQIENQKGNFDEALAIHKYTLDVAIKFDDAEGKSASLQQIADIYLSRGELDKAMPLYQQSLEIDEKLGHQQGKAINLNNMAQIYVARGNLYDAMRIYQQSLDISEKLGDLKSKASTLNNMAVILYNQGDSEGAIKLSQDSLDISQQLGDLLDKGTSLNNIGAFLFKNGQYHFALKYFVEALIAFQSVQAQSKVQSVVSWLIGFRKEIGTEKFDVLWQEEIGQPIPEWLGKVDNQQEQGMTVEKFIVDAIQSAREGRPEAEGYFKAAQKMVIDSNAPAELQSLGKMLQRIMIGEKNVDLSVLTDELREMVEKALGG